MSADFSCLKRARHPRPGFVRSALKARGLMVAYRVRPAYQQNDYIGWINRAKRQETKEKRLRQMLDELERGGVYMNMKHAASKKEVMLPSLVEALSPDKALQPDAQPLPGFASTERKHQAPKGEANAAGRS